MNAMVLRDDFVERPAAWIPKVAAQRHAGIIFIVL